MQNTKDFEYETPGLLPYDPIILVLDVLRRWLLVLVVAVVVGVGTYIAADMMYQPEYETSATLVVTTRDSTATVYTNLKSTSEIAAVFTELLNSSVLQKIVLEELGLNGISYTVTAKAIADTNLLTLKVTAQDPMTAFLVIRSLIDHHEVVTTEVIGDIIIETLQLPQIPTGPVNPQNTLKVVATAMIAAAMAVCGAIVLFSYSRNTVRNRKEAEQKLQCWCLGEIRHERRHKTAMDFFRRKHKGMVITNPDCSFHFVESIRKLRRRTEQKMENGKVLMITSVAENEGKSTIAVNLALSLAKKHEKVLLVDMDLRKPACHMILGKKPGRYTTVDLLNNRAQLCEAVQDEPLSGLDLVLERSVLSLSTDQILPLLNSLALEKMLKQARETYSYVVLDLPPMSVASDTEYIMEHADASLLVIRQGQVEAKSLNKAIDTLQKGKANLLGCVLNNVYTNGIPVNTDGGYGYGYGRYGAYGKEGRSGYAVSRDV
jgi:capsular exopolysaccharide synthesis family protein